MFTPHWNHLCIFFQYCIFFCHEIRKDKDLVILTISVLLIRSLKLSAIIFICWMELRKQNMNNCNRNFPPPFFLFSLWWWDIVCIFNCARYSFQKDSLAVTFSYRERCNHSDVTGIFNILSVITHLPALQFLALFAIPLYLIKREQKKVFWYEYSSNHDHFRFFLS